MLFKGINNQSIEFKITNYQFPEITDCGYDSNWLMVFVKVKSNFGDWEATDPSLLVSDLKEIIEWFEKLSNNNQIDSDSLWFMEPNLEFQLIKNQSDLKTVRITFDMELRPKNPDNSKKYFVDCEMDNEELKRVVKELTKQLESFPERATE